MLVFSYRQVFIGYPVLVPLMAEIFRSSIVAVDRGNGGQLALWSSQRSLLSVDYLTSGYAYSSSLLVMLLLIWLESSSLAAMITVPDIFQMC